jgi:hypothetical protein
MDGALGEKFPYASQWNGHVKVLAGNRDGSGWFRNYASPVVRLRYTWKVTPRAV